MTNTPPIPAEEITDALLTQTGEALDTGNFDAFAECFHLPHHIKTSGSETIIQTRAELKETFDRVRRTMRASGADQLIRYIQAASYRSPTIIVSTHVSQAVNGTMRLEEPYPVLSVVELINGKWVVTSSDYAVSQNSPKGRAMTPIAAGAIAKEHDHAEN